MKKKVFSLVMVMLFASIMILSATGKDFDVSVAEGAGEYDVTFTVTNYAISVEVVDGVSYSVIDFAGDAVTMETGYAEVPIIGAAIQVDGEAAISSEVVDVKYVDVALDAELLPSRGVILRNQNPDEIPYATARASVVDAAYPGEVAKTLEPFILRDVRGVNVQVYPFQYNAAQKTVRVYESVTVRVKESAGAAINALPAANTEILPVAESMYASVFENYKRTRALAIGEMGDILVIYTSRDQAEIVPYVNWKTEKGYNVSTKMVSTGKNVKSDIADAYAANKNLLYVQLVGDWADIKSDIGSSGNAPMDPMMGCVVGTDNFPDIIVGRFSAQSASDVRVQVNKTIKYERDTKGGSWLSTGLGIASDEGAGQGDDGEADYQHMDIIKENRLLPFTYNTVHEAYKQPAKSVVVNAVNNGLTIINYVGHGSHSAWGTSGYSTSDINNATNGDKLPFIISVACVNGEFHTGGDCFGERWLKKENGGAIATIMATINQPWAPPMKGQDYMNDILIGGYDYSSNPGNGNNVTEQRTTFGAITFNGAILMHKEDTSSSARDTIQTWTIFGDCSVQVRTDDPAMISVSSKDVVVGRAYSGTLSSTGKVAGALVSISQNGKSYSAVADANGSFSINHSLAAGSAKLVVTGFNLETIYEDVIVGNGGPTPTPSPTPVKNVALGKPVVVSGEYSAQYAKAGLVDGKTSTVWGSAYNAGPQWFFVDLGKEYDVVNVVVDFYNPYYSPKYYVGVSNDAVNWDLPVEVTNGDGGKDELKLGKKARYVGVYLTNGAMNVYGVKEFEVNIYDIPVTPTPTATPVITPTPTATPTATPIETPWKAGVDYKVGDVVSYEGAIWVCSSAHLSNAAWYPGAPGVYLWKKQ